MRLSPLKDDRRMQELTCGGRIMGVSNCISLSFSTRVQCLQSFLARKLSLNRQYCLQTVLPGGLPSRASIVPDTSRDWEPPAVQKLYEDDWVLAISKPGGLFVHNSKEASKDEKERKAFLKDLVEIQHTEGSGEGRSLLPVHRLDRGASGVILFAKSSNAAHAAQLALAHEDTVKEYLVLARGSTPDSFICDDPVNDDKGIPRSAWTKCDKLLDLPKSRCSLLKVYIKTGRRHQIRKHLNHKAFHVIGDGAHGKGRTNQYFRENYQMPLGRCFLHAARLTIPHPSIFSAQCTNRQRPTGSLETLHIQELEGNSELSINSIVPIMKVDSGSVPTLAFAKPTGDLAGDCFPQVLSLRASLPTDLRQVLFALPDGVTCDVLNSLEVLI
ncbi:unnamed protein product [Calypogeia fissa]